MKLAQIKIFGEQRIKIYNCNEVNAKERDGIIVEGEEGLEFAELLDFLPSFLVLKEDVKIPKVLRVMTKEDEEHFLKKLDLELKAFDVCKHYCNILKIPLKLVQVRYNYDLKKGTFIYTAAGRVDFRQLIKDLARELKIKIEMRQIGVRDEAKLLGGCGTCGYGLCCTTHLNSFAPVSVKMAKVQGLVLNPSKILGVCGRLKCCLYYEYYEDQQEEKVLYFYEEEDYNISEENI